MEDRTHHRQELGKIGEDIACQFLISKGHMVLERNWRWRHLEIDLVTWTPEGIHFVEVKTRRFNIQAPPQENVDKMKQKRIAQAAQKFLMTSKGLPFSENECFFDVAAITFEGNEACIDYLEQAYIPIYL
ncbi:MAG: YraN family protein [Bacteroidales bacterium]|nr:YraN family protein [Bacteroidales bacterium]MBQ6688677.1 YraN family protein [Bacteroidales bacterium]